MIGGKCKKEYPITQETPDPSELIDIIFPSSVFGGNVMSVLNILSNAFSKITPTSGVGYYADKALQLTAGLIASVATYGAGGDMAVNLLYAIKNGIIMTMEIIKILNVVAE